MKLYHLFFFLFISSLSIAQTKLYEDQKYVAFSLKYAKDTTTVDGIDWKKEKLFSEFTLKGIKEIKYAISIHNQNSASLLYFQKGKWEIQEKINITGLTLRRIANKVIISEFKITDFNNDGNEDIVCWANTNINGNEWSLIYLNDTENQKLVKLWNDADETDIWARPLYDTEAGTIRTQRDGGAYGTSDESIFTLDGIETNPVSKHYQDRKDEIITDYYYIGNDGKWELYEKLQDNTRQVIFKLPKGANNVDAINWTKEKLTSEFTLNGATPLKFNITLISTTEAILSELLNNQWIVRDSLNWFEWQDSYNQEEGFTYSFKITDFNRDGNEDLICWTHTDENNNELTSIYINDPTTKTLVKLKSIDNGIWASPEFDKLTDIILCNTVSGKTGTYYESKYSLNGTTATPVYKKEYIINSSLDNEGTLKTYVGESDTWKFITEEKFKLDNEE